MEAIVSAAVTAMATAAGTDGWQPLRSALVALWRRVAPADTSRVERDLDAVPERLLEARRVSGDERAVLDPWREQLLRLLVEHPELAGTLEQIVRTAPDRPGNRSTLILGVANDHGTVTQFGGDQINYRS